MPEPLPYKQEHLVASLAVQRATLVTRKVLSSLDKGILSKNDSSPVSLADFAAQALIVTALRTNFPKDSILGEESADELRQNSQLANQVWELVQSTRLEDKESDELLGMPSSLEEMLDLIDQGGATEPSKTGRCWTIDPVDGTKTFLAGSQYCVVASLLEDGEEKVAAIACPYISPSLPTPPISEAKEGVDKQSGGVLVSAVKDQGCWARPLGAGALRDARKVQRSQDIEPSEFVFTENADSTTAQVTARCKIAERLGARWSPVHIYSTQLKYVACALGACDVYIRAPKRPSSGPYVWDHAGGILIFEESGGKVSDFLAKRIVLGAGRRLSENIGVVAAPMAKHEEVLKVAQDVMRDSEEYSSVLRGHI